MRIQPLRRHRTPAVIPAPLRRHSRTPPPSFPHPSPSFPHPSTVIPAVFKREPSPTLCRYSRSPLLAACRGRLLSGNPLQPIPPHFSPSLLFPLEGREGAPECGELPYFGEFSWVAVYCPHPGPLPEGEGAQIFPLPLGEGQRVREEKNEENAQIGRFYTNFTQPLPFFSRLFFISRSLFLAILFLKWKS